MNNINWDEMNRVIALYMKEFIPAGGIVDEGSQTRRSYFDHYPEYHVSEKDMFRVEQKLAKEKKLWNRYKSLLYRATGGVGDKSDVCYFTDPKQKVRIAYTILKGKELVNVFSERGKELELKSRLLEGVKNLGMRVVLTELIEICRAGAENSNTEQGASWVQLVKDLSVARENYEKVLDGEIGTNTF